MSPAIWILSIFLTMASTSSQSQDGNVLQAWRRTWGVVPAQVQRTWRGNDPCNAVPAWFGVSCEELYSGRKTQRVTKIDFTDPEGQPVRFAGSLPNSINKLTELQVIELLDLPGLRGKIPRSITKLRKLAVVFFFNTSLRGNIKNLTKIPNLRELWVDGNKFGGKIPNRLPKTIQRVGLYNEGFRGKFPKWRKLNNLLSLEFSNLKRIRGRWPRTFRSMKNVDEMVIRGTGLKGKIPGKNFLPNKMRYLRLPENKLVGKLPKSWGKKNAFTNLRRVDLYSNRGIRGKVPLLWARNAQSKMRDVDLYLKPGNPQLCGKVPRRLSVMNYENDWKTKSMGSCSARRRRRRKN